MTHWKRSPRAGLGLLALALALALAAPGNTVSLAAGTIIYVDADATGSHNGTSWANAFTDLQAGLNAATTTPAEIWVAEGTYKPAVEYGGTGDRYKAFQLQNGVALYGGFDPSVGHDSFAERDWVAHPTIISGDLGVPGNNADNSYHVFYHPSGTNLDSTAVLDGFTITGGNANGSDAASSGGGMYNTGSPALTRCIFLSNMATNGGGMYNTGSPVLTSCIFAGNSTGENGDGGGMYNTGAAPRLINCVFTGNSARDGAGMYNVSSAPQLVGCTFSRNSTPGLGTGGITNYGSQSTTLTNCILWGNDNSQILSSPELATWAVLFSDIQGGYASPGGNLNVDPLFVDPDGADNVVGTVDDDLRLGVSPDPYTETPVNAGSASLLPADTADLDRDGNTSEAIPLDLDGYPRVVNGAVDMGAYERQNLPPVLDVSGSSSGDDVRLTFAHAGEGVTYQVWRGSYPDFVVVSEGTNLGNVCKISGATVTCTLVDAITNPPVTSFYVVRAAYAAQGGAFSDSNRIGMIGFVLAPGM